MSSSRGAVVARQVCRALAACAVAGAWAVLGYGLFSSGDAQVWGDLEAGGRGAASIAVYLPYLAMTLVVALVVLCGLVGKPDVLWPLVATTVAIGLFSFWVSLQYYLFPAQPHLWASVAWCFVADAVAAASLAVAWATSSADRIQPAAH
ncbi:hypothetical protein [Micromonospora sp. WMMD1155]|uniref:hypothetical protein n=1 Tax=Micromonospora sp. WMMD1155 TaxID=3016094 RepID=UPI00249A25EA|nr:hypothetical protein [Micromonospora sp. WMMD1155]WFE54608.1 hypothetical protein O7617_31565 [Micromonospora sp. WMMD1155]